MKQRPAVSIVVPTLNEVGNMPTLLKRIDVSMKLHHIPYEVVIIDDHSSDGTLLAVEKLSTTFPVRASTKQGKPGKAYSLLEGFKKTQFPLTAMIDADLQYPPEEIARMYALLLEKDADVVVTRREEKKTSRVRKLSSQIFNLFFAKLLFGINFDTQSGLKLFKKRILNTFEMDPSPWSFDLEFIVRSLENKFKIISHDIPFGERESGVTKVKLISSTLELVKASLKLRWRTSLKKTRAGYRANTRFLERAFPASVIALVIGLAVSMPMSHHASALSLDKVIKPVTSSVNKTLDGVGNLLGANPPKSGAIVAAPASGNSMQNSTATGTPQNPSNGGNNANPQATGQDNASASDHRTNSVSNWTASNGSSIKLANTDTSKLSAATALNKESSIYDSGYPNYKLSTSKVERFSKFADLALIVGGFLLLSVILFISSRAVNKMHRYRKILRS